MADSKANEEDTISQNRRSVEVAALGLTRIDRSFEDPRTTADADIVFVHGLRGHPRTTWEANVAPTIEKAKSQGKKRCYEGKPKQLDAPSSTKLFWPADILPDDFKSVRILTYGYDSHVTRHVAGSANQNNIFEHGKNLLNTLMNDRDEHECGERPIIFVAHSLGGLLVKQALIEARKFDRQDPEYSIYSQTIGVIFFGTPHEGSDKAAWGRWLISLAKVAQLDVNDAILMDLDPASKSSKLKELRRDFHDILEDKKHVGGTQALQAHSFQEGRGMVRTNMLSGKVVSDASSSFDSRQHRSDTIDADHTNMCRFASRDNGYKLFRGVLRRFLKIAEKERQSKSEAHLAGLLQSLDYSDRNARRHQLYNADAEATFSWLWSSSTFPNWLSSEEDAIYCIYGKPGSGKSTLMDHIIDHKKTLRTLEQGNKFTWRIIHFFFDFRTGKAMTNNFEGLLRSLTYQLLDNNAGLPSNCIEKLKAGLENSWHEQHLRDVVETCFINVCENLCVFIDGLDEYGGDLRNLLTFVKHLVCLHERKDAAVKICLSSRPKPLLTLFLGHDASLSISDFNEPGIFAYSQHVLHSMNFQSANKCLESGIAKRAEGVFLWARFALDELVKGFAEGENEAELLNRLDALPRELEDLYDRMLLRLSPAAKKECFTMLQLVCFAKSEGALFWKPGIFWQELRAATQFAVDGSPVSSIDPSRQLQSRHEFVKRMRAKSCGFLELADDKHALDPSMDGVKLIHKSVRTYLDKKGWSALDATNAYTPSQHEKQLLLLCGEYLRQASNDGALQFEISSEKMKAESRQHITDQHTAHTILRYPFLSYAASGIFAHARSLEERYNLPSYEILHEYLPISFITTHMYISRSQKFHVGGVNIIQCYACARCLDDSSFWTDDFTWVAILHGFKLYEQNSLKKNEPNRQHGLSLSYARHAAKMIDEYRQKRQNYWGEPRDETSAKLKNPLTDFPNIPDTAKITKMARFCVRGALPYLNFDELVATITDFYVILKKEVKDLETVSHLVGSA